MWIAMNDSFVSAVKNSQDKSNKTVMVRARVREDLINLCPGKKIIETPNSDYRFRVIIDKKEFANILANRALDIDYPNFKNTVKEKWRHDAYLKIWTTMYNVQNSKYPRDDNWWQNYRNYPASSSYNNNKNYFDYEDDMDYDPLEDDDIPSNYVPKVNKSKYHVRQRNGTTVFRKNKQKKYKNVRNVSGRIQKI